MHQNKTQHEKSLVQRDTLIANGEKLTLRIATESDAENIVELKKQVLPDSFGKILGLSVEEINQANGPETIKQTKEYMKTGTYYIFENSNQEIIGVSAACDDGEIRTVYVRQDYQRKGLGKILISKCIEILKTLTIPIKVTTLTQNSSAIEFYKIRKKRSVEETWLSAIEQYLSKKSLWSFSSNLMEMFKI